MATSSFRYLGCLAAVMAAAGLICVSMATGQTSPNSVEQFLANSPQVLARNPNGGARLTSPIRIRDVSTSRPGALQTTVNALTGASADQQSAIAYKIVIKTDQSYATRLAEAIANSISADAKTAYAAVDDTLTGAAGGVGGGAGGGSGGAIGGADAFGTSTNAFAGQGSSMDFLTSTHNATGGAPVFAEHPRLPA